MNESTAAPDMCISMPEIAELAQVKRPVVSTWRRRYLDFPRPIDSRGGRPLFSGQQVVDWLVTTGLGNTEPEQLKTDLLLHSIAAVVSANDPFTEVEILGALICLRHLVDGRQLVDMTSADPAAALRHRAGRIDREDEYVLREIRDAGEELLPLARFADSLVDASSEHRAFEALLAARTRFRTSALVADTVAHELRHLLATVAQIPQRLNRDESVTVADFHAGVGDLLATLVTATDERSGIRALGAETDPRLARIARRRLLLAGVEEFGLDIQVGLNVEERIADPDVIVTVLPYKPGETRTVINTLIEVERVTDLLGPASIGLVVGPTDAMVDELTGTEESKLRSALLTSVVDAVVALPAGSLPYRPGYRCSLWMVSRRRVSAAIGRVLLADISAEPLSKRVCEGLAEDLVLWRAEGYRPADGHDPRFGRVVAIEELDRVFGRSLLPPGPPVAQLFSRLVAERPALIADAEGRWADSVDAAQKFYLENGPYAGRIHHRTGSPVPRTTLAQLISAGSVRRISGHRLRQEDVQGHGHHIVLGAEEVTGKCVVGSRRIDRLALAEYDRVVLTEPGDVVYTVAPEPGFIVDYKGFNVVAFPARVLRVDPAAEGAMTPRVLSALLGAVRGIARSPSAVRPALRVEDCHLPVLSAQEIRAFDAALADLDRRERLLRTQLDHVREVRQLTIAGLADGSLTLDR
ncbi:hypothetical protein J2W56_005546 [Nocardia kruczakiae]|uniref:N-6 DNA methylase n=1 Tax=Nocardia kruczakiae TaxID=261477 RepID=A0ABU1XMJ5_9NOCA|nr:hypothetical protein [Nocardia kruczakiae]MDR7171785.1 hypothetical protein [Nocardia kruczakiae]